MKIIAGLGNPGRKYHHTRHNVGFDVAHAVATLLAAAPARNRFEAETFEGSHAGEKVLVLCPQTYMNLSGRSIREAMNFYKLQPIDLLVISDDLNLETGRIRLRPSGSAGGQKGLASTISQLSTDQFARLRIGVGRPPQGYEVSDYVLGKFNDAEMQLVGPAIQTSADAALLWLKSGIAESMNRYNATPDKKKATSKRSRRVKTEVPGPTKPANAVDEPKSESPSN